MNSVIRSPSAKYRITYSLGRGQQGSVHCAENIQTGDQYALKQVDISSALFRQTIYKEVSIHQQLKHPNVIRYIESFAIGDVLYIVLECGYCSLATYLEACEDKCLNEPRLVLLLKDICSGIEYIHSRGIIHRDIKIENVIVIHDRFKISDFGVSTNSLTSQTFVGTPLYLAPEVLNNQVFNDIYDKSVDLWSLGVLAFYAYFGVSPFFYEGTKLMNKNHLDVINDNILNICADKFQIRKVIERLFYAGLKRYASFVAQKALQSSKQLMRLFERLFVYYPYKRAGIEEILQLLGVMGNLDHIKQSMLERGDSKDFLFRDDSLLKYIGGSFISSSRSDTTGSQIHNDLNNSLLRTNSYIDRNSQLSQSITYQEITDAQLPQKMKYQALSDEIAQPSVPQPLMPLPIQYPQIPQIAQPQPKNQMDELARKFAGIHIIPKNSFYNSMPEQILRSDSVNNSFSPVLNKNMPQQPHNQMAYGSPHQFRRSNSVMEGSPIQVGGPPMQMSGPPIQVGGSPNIQRSNSKSPIIILNSKKSYINFLIETRILVIQLNDDIEKAKKIIASIEYLIMQFEYGNPKIDTIFADEINYLRKLDYPTRRKSIQNLFLVYYTYLSSQANNPLVVHALYRLLICSVIRNISNDLQRFMTHFKNFYQTDNIKFYEIEKFVEICTTKHLPYFYEFITKCYP